MNQFYSYFMHMINSSTVSIMNVIDILITAFLIYKIIGWIRGTQAEQVAKGIIILVVITQVSDWLGLVTINYILRNVMTVGLVALVVMFQPELRRVLEKIGGTKLLNTPLALFSSSKEETVDIEASVKEIVRGTSQMAKRNVGALIVVEKEARLDSIVKSGIALDCIVTAEVLNNIFEPNTPLHDGAVILSGETMRIMAASCLLPLTQNQTLSKDLGTRHRAAVGMSEISDATVIVVSEETGNISYAQKAKLTKNVTPEELENALLDHFADKLNKLTEKTEKKGWFKLS